MKKSLILLVLPLLLAAGCDGENTQLPTREDLVIANCYAVRDSADAYAARNGVYPDYLGRSPWLHNPFTFELTEPGRYALNPGETGYISYWVEGKQAGYLITGFGETGEIIRLRNNEERLVIANCYALRDSAEAYAAKNGEYPEELNRYSRSPWLYNPFTWNLTEPIVGYGHNPGESGYISYRARGEYVGYLITGFGKTGEIIMLNKNYPDSLIKLDRLVIANCYIVQAAAEAFAEENNGAYPDDVGVDETPAGNTLIDFLPGDTSFENPFTTSLTEPINGSAYSPGQNGYADLRDANATSVGYVITGFGSQQTIITIRKFPGQPF